MDNHTKDLKNLVNRHCKVTIGYNTELRYIHSEPTIDPVTKRVVPGLMEVQILKLRLNQQKDPDTENTQGSDRDRIYMTGYLVDPKVINFDLGDCLKGTYRYESNNWVNCEFYPVPELADSFTTDNNLHTSTGRRIRGYLKLEGVN